MDRLTQKIIASLLAATLLFAVGSTQGQEAPAVPAVPNPADLSADWWAYFAASSESDGPPIEEQIAAFLEVLQSGLETLPPERLEVVLPLSDQLSASLEKYEAIVSAEIESEEILVLPSEKYTVTEALERFRKWRKLHRDLESLQKELEWQESLLARAFSQQTQSRSSYLNLSAPDPTRFSRGIQLMNSRVGLEVRKQELESQKVNVEKVQGQVDSLQSELEEIPERLYHDAEDLKVWEKNLETATAAWQQVQTEGAPSGAAKEQLFESSTFAVARKALLESTAHDLRVQEAQLTLSLSQIAYHLEESLLNEVAPDQAKEQKELDAANGTAKAAEKISEEADRILSRSRAAATDQLANLSDDAALTDLLKETMALADEAETIRNEVDEKTASIRFLTQVFQERILDESGWFRGTTGRAKDYFSNLPTKIGNILKKPIFEFNETPLTALGLIQVAVILLFTWWFSKGARHALRRFGQRRKNGKESTFYMLERILHYVVLTIGVLFALSALGLDLTKLAIFASALGVGIGFGLQTIASNFVAGLIVLFEKSLNVGDFVELQSGVTGEVREINMRSTLITTNDNVDILVPNSEFVSGTVTNWTLREALRRIRVSFGVAYGTDKDLVREAVLQAADNVPWTFADSPRRRPQVWLVNFGDSSLDFELVVWLKPEAVKRPGAVESDYLWEIETCLTKHGIEIPFPQRDLHIRSGFQPVRLEEETEPGKSQDEET